MRGTPTPQGDDEDSYEKRDNPPPTRSRIASIVTPVGREGFGIIVDETAKKLDKSNLLASPSYLPKCPKCGKDNSSPAREWVGGAKTTKPMKVRRFICSSCGTGYVVWVDSKTGAEKIMTRKG